MSLRLTLSAVAGAFLKAIAEGEKPIARAGFILLSAFRDLPKEIPPRIAPQVEIGIVPF